MNHSPIIGIDMGASNIRGGIVENGALHDYRSSPLNTGGSFDAVLENILRFIGELTRPGVKAIGLGVPGLVDRRSGMVTGLLNIPSWEEIALAPMISEKFGMPVKVENDAGCFALGEFHFGKGKGCRSLLGVTIGTGLGTGIVIDGKSWPGSNGGAGEFGLMEYLGRNLECYASGQFFNLVHGREGTEVYKSAADGNGEALAIYQEFGKHLAKGLKMMLYALDPEIIILGGSVSQAYDYFSSSMLEELRDFAFPRTIERLKLEVTSLQNSAVLGAAALHY